MNYITKTVSGTAFEAALTASNLLASTFYLGGECHLTEFWMVANQTLQAWKLACCGRSECRIILVLGLALINVSRTVFLFREHLKVQLFQACRQVGNLYVHVTFACRIPRYHMTSPQAKLFEPMAE